MNDKEMESLRWYADMWAKNDCVGLMCKFILEIDERLKKLEKRI